MGGDPYRAGRLTHGVVCWHATSLTGIMLPCIYWVAPLSQHLGTLSAADLLNNSRDKIDWFASLPASSASLHTGM
jgi:hypothetical protein